MSRRFSIGAAAIVLVMVLGSCKKPQPLFTTMPSSETHVNFVNKLENKHLFSILYYLYFYNGGGVSTGDINNDGLPDIYFTANSKGANKLYLNKGNFQFEDITDKAGVKGLSDWCTGSTMADVNGDGYLDIYVSTVSNKYGLTGHNELYINNKNNTFTESSADYGLNTSCFTTQTAFFDYDNDGDLDCFILNQSHHPHANIVDTSNRHKYDSSSGDRLYRNDLNTPAHKFVDVSAQAGLYQSNLGYGLGIAIGDMNNDGWNDIYVGNDFHENDYYYINNGNGTFTESGADHFKHYSRFSMGNDIADYNNDGQLDVVTVDMLPPDEKTLKTYGSDENLDIYNVKLMYNGYQNQYSRNTLQRNNGNGGAFSDVALSAGIPATDWSWCPLFADFDNDGNKDLFISSGIVKRPVDMDYVRFVSDLKLKGMDRTDKYDNQAIDAMPDGASHPFLFRGNGELKFEDVSKDWGTGKMKGYYNGSSYADLDNDGNVDLVVNCINSEALILKNNAPKKNQLTLSFSSDSTNHFGIGAKAYLFSKGKMQYNQLMLTRGFESSCEARLHFGMDTTTVADSLVIVWPSHLVQVLHNVKANQQLVIKESDASVGLFKRFNAFFPETTPLLSDITAQTGITWKHKENDFVDFNKQYLIPHELSTRGPKIAVGDVNNDGLDDMYVCGAKFQAGALMVQQSNGSFQSVDTSIFNHFAVCEDVDATFFDANGDGFQDLWVVSGGNEMPVSDVSSADRLYINDGKGHFTLTMSNIPQLFENKSCVATADVDHDGDQDVFVGFLSDPMKYGIPQSSYLYINDGKGKFTIAPATTMNLINVGMVTSATFTDLNKDGWPDLAMAGEWMGVKIFMNNKGVFTPQQIPQSTGLWQALYATDVNGDGYNDLLAGNWGHNSKLWSGKNGPLKLYVKDFDNNGSIEQIMCYTIDGKQYTFLAKDELERSLPILKKAYLTYGEVAGKSVQYMFYDLFKDYQELTAEEMGSCCFLNDGKGNFKKMVLPEDLQLSPVFSFAPLTPGGKGNYVLGGNFYGTVPYEGRYDAQPLSAFQFNAKGGAFSVEKGMPRVDGEIRDSKWLTTINGKKMMVIARNNGTLVFLQ